MKILCASIHANSVSMTIYWQYISEIPKKHDQCLQENGYPHQTRHKFIILGVKNWVCDQWLTVLVCRRYMKVIIPYQYQKLQYATWCMKNLVYMRYRKNALYSCYIVTLFCCARQFLNKKDNQCLEGTCEGTCSITFFLLFKKSLKQEKYTRVWKVLLKALIWSHLQFSMHCCKFFCIFKIWMVIIVCISFCDTLLYNVIHFCDTFLWYIFVIHFLWYTFVIHVLW